MPLMIQTAAAKKDLSKGRKGPAAPPNALLLSVVHLPNPHGPRLERFKTSMSDSDWREWNRRSERERVKFFLEKCAPTKLRAIVCNAQQAIQGGRPIVIVCKAGRDRSPAVAEIVADTFHCSKVYLVHRELS
tara:strand:+ start:1935 stop:2330 length:396 start_codon:yes stop_codon:yes gene_type:complete